MSVNKKLFAEGDIVTALTDTARGIRKGEQYKIVMVLQKEAPLGAVYADYHVVSLVSGERMKIRNGHLTFTK